MTASKEAILEHLNPADCFTLAMDDEIRRDGLAGSYGCFALELSKTPDIAVLENRIVEFGQRFPVANASLQRIGRRFYWCRRKEAPVLFHRHICPPNREEADFIQDTMLAIVNHQEAREQVAPIEFHLIAGAARHVFSIRWLHPLCDARGVDLIIQFLCTEDAERRKQFGHPPSMSLVDVHLARYRWWQKVGLFLKGKRYVQSLDRMESIQPFSNQAPSRLNFSVHRLTEEQTGQVAKLARQTVGLTGTSLYYIGCLMRALDGIGGNASGQAYCVPYAFNLRKQRALTPMTGNHVCALFAQAPRAIVQDREQLFAHLKQQNADVIRRRQDYAFLPLMWAGSWLSLPEYGKTLRVSYGSGKERSSFWFSDIGRLEPAQAQLAGADICDVFHACQVTSPPGLAFLVCIFQGRLTLSYNFVEPSGSIDFIERLHAGMLSELLGESA